MSEPPVLVLVVEDGTQTRRFLRTTLTALDYRVREAGTVAEALVEVTAHNPDVILMDPALPDGDGIDLTHRQVLNELWGSPYVGETHNLRPFMAALRRKVEQDPARPQLLLTEPVVGYRMKGD